MTSALARRQVLRLAGLASAGAFLAWNTGSRALARWTVGRRLAPLRRLPALRPEPGLVEAELVARPETVRVGGQWATLATYNGSFPGPVLNVREGEHVRLRFVNELPEATNLHLHGLHVSPMVDDPFLSIPPGESTLYEFTIPDGSRGLHWYHPHLHGRVARQLFAGLAGVIVVTGSEDDAPELRNTDHRLIILKDLELEGGQPAGHGFADWMGGKEGSLRLVNGALTPMLVATHNLLRLRLLNASNARYYRLALEGHDLHLIATDAGWLARPRAIGELLLAPGERAEVVIRLDRAGEFALLDLGYDRGAAAMHMGGMGGAVDGRALEPARLMTIVAPARRDGGAIPSTLASVEDLRGIPPASTRRFVLGEGMMGTRFTINGRTFDPGRVDVAAERGALEVWEIENRGRMDHPFHLHTYPFQVLSKNGAAENVPAWKDVVNVEPGEIVRLAVPLRDLVGRTVYHCHIAEHEDQGMMGTLEVADRT